MELIYFDEYLKKEKYPLVVTIGSFDGIHLGHQKLIKETVKLSKIKGYKSAVITFDPHPLTIINKINRLNILTLSDKFKLIEKFDVDFLIVIKFDEQFLKISKNDFVTKYLLKLNTKDVVVGDDFKFGYKGEGKAVEITELSNNLITTKIIEIVKIDNEKIGSTKIIKLLNNGNIEQVNNLLGYNYNFIGNVIKGKQIGRKIGFPTANINNDDVKRMLKTGVYGVNVYFNNKSFLGMMNIGHNPTCNFTDNLSIEINLFDVDINLYDQTLKIEVFCFIRDELKFNNVDELIAQLEKDKKNIINKNLMLAKK
ncbi:MAG: bifunctional riboflavin kinase/FAD synthetase [Erysipelotrichaceae bacterium]|nr:bifunctional riboflavin kinase/FAD synthetase [Erysipelotrichaceae bacterium]